MRSGKTIHAISAHAEGEVGEVIVWRVTRQCCRSSWSAIFLSFP